MKRNLIQYISVLALLNILLFSPSGQAQVYSLFGVTTYGGAYNKGVMYKYTYPSGKDTVILNFDGTNGSYERGCIILASDRNIYGMTTEGGSSNDGVLYCINPVTYDDTVLISFNGANGSEPNTGLMQANNGLLYGLTSAGGTHNKGLFFSYDIVTKTEIVLFSFDGINGANPTGHCIQASNGLIYGHTSSGGASGYGTIFYYNINTGQDSVVFDFDGLDGNKPRGFMQASNGLIYGNTYSGGDSNYGVVFSFDPATKIYNVIINFNGSNGIYPCGDGSSLYQSSSGLLYGITQMGGTYNNGLLYSYDINTSKDSILFDFSSAGVPGKDPYAAGFVQIPGGQLICPIDSGGSDGLGTLISYDPVSGLVKKLLDFNDTNGAFPTSDLIIIPNHSEEGINNIRNNEPTTLFPNPNNGIFTIDIPGITGQSIVEIYNLLGEKICLQALPPGKNNYTLNLSAQPSGIYLYRVVLANGNEVSAGKFVIE